MTTHVFLSGLAFLFAWGPPRFGEEDPTLAQTLGKAFFPVAAYVAIAPVLWFFFRRTWRELDVESHEHQRKTLIAGGYDYRPAVLFVITAVVLTLQEYYGGRDFFFLDRDTNAIGYPADLVSSQASVVFEFESTHNSQRPRSVISRTSTRFEIAPSFGKARNLGWIKNHRDEVDHPQRCGLQ